MKNKKVRKQLGIVFILMALSMGACGSEQNNDSVSATNEQVILEEDVESKRQTEGEDTFSSEEKENENANNTDFVSEQENAEEGVAQTEEGTSNPDAVQMVRPIQVSSCSVYDGSTMSEYCDEDGDIIRKTDNRYDRTYTYLTDELGNKVFGWDAFDIFSLDYGNKWRYDGKIPSTEVWSHNLWTDEEAIYSTGERYSTEYRYDENHRVVGMGTASISYISEEDGLLLKYSDYGDSDYVCTGEAKLDKDGYLKTLSFVNGNLYLWNQEFKYDDNKNVITYITSLETTDDWDRKHTFTTTTCTYTYDDKGNMLTEQRICTEYEYDYSSGIENSKTEKSERIEYGGYDAYGNYTIRKYYENEEMKEAYFYEYDESGKLLKESMVFGDEERVVEFKYDEKSRLSRVYMDGMVVIEFVYDEEGRLVKTISENAYAQTEYEKNKYFANPPLEEDIEERVLDKIVKAYTGYGYDNSNYFNAALTFTYE